MIFLYSMVSVLGLKAQDMHSIRGGLEKAVRDKKLCAEMIESLEPLAAEALYLAYLGAYEAIWANHLLNPFAKLASFKKGKKNINQAVYVAPKNIEIRFVRLTIQQNAPSFLSYQQNKLEDAIFIQQNKHDGLPSDLLNRMDKLLVR